MSDPEKDVYAAAGFFCEKFKISRTTWWRITKSQGFPHPVRFGRSVRWNVKSVISFLNKGEKL